jgi:cytochrome c oxidase cbb3-type subunit 3
MADFTSSFWSWFIGITTIVSILFCYLLTRWMSTTKHKPQDTAETTEHVWDEDLRELNNPLPRWWVGLFYITLVFSIGYLVLYPGLGSFAGILDWSSVGQYDKEMVAAQERLGPIYQQYLEQDIAGLAQDEQALATGQRLFINHCSTCHGSDARGARGFPNLRDEEWLWGGTPEAIQTTILEGRTGIMPAWSAALGGSAGVSDVTDYVLSLSGREHDAAAAARGKEKFDMLCVACHGAEGKGNPALGAPDLTNNVWLHGGSRARIEQTIAAGRQGMMPGHREFLGEGKVHLLAAYVYSLSSTGD